MKSSRTGLSLAGLLAALALQPVDAHSWAEMLMRIASNGTMIGTPGYMRGYASRANPGFSDTMDTFLIPPNGRSTGNQILSTDSLCHPSQTIGNYSTQFPKLSATAGDYVAIRYQENGHVTLPNVNPTKPLNRGTIYIYGTDNPSDDEKFLDVFQKWTADGTGGNGRGRLLATRNFDDGQCYQVNGDTISQQRQAQFSKVAEDPQGTDLWCQNDLQLPSDLASGSTYTLYWVWSWPTFDKAGAPTDIAPDGYTVTTNQFYTSCIDVAVTDDSSSGGTTSNQVKSKGSSIAASFLHGQDLNSAAVLSQLEVGAFEVAVPGSGNSSSPSASGSGGSSSSSTATTTPATTTRGSGPETIVVTVTTTEAPVYVTITVPASSSSDHKAATATPATTSSSSTSSSSSSTRKPQTHTTTIYDHATVTETVSAPPSSSSSSRTSTFIRSSRQRSTSSSTVSTTTDSGSRTPTLAPTVQPFLNGTNIVAGPGSTTLLRVPRYRRRA